MTASALQSRNAAVEDLRPSTPAVNQAQEEVRRLLAELAGLAGPSGLHVARTDIEFRNVTPECVAVAVTVRNLGGERSGPTAALLMAAPFGAFVPWRELAVLPVPALAPGQSHVLRTEAFPAAPEPLGSPDRVPPRRLLTALAADDGRDRRGARMLRSLWVRTLGGAALEDPSAQATPGLLPADLFRLLGQGSLHWAGNLNIFLGERAVERHSAQALRIHPGRVNLADFVLGSGRDAYAFRFEGGGADWDAALYDMTGGRSLVPDFRSAEPLEEGRWLEVNGTRILALAVRPPEGCPQGKVEVHVRQHSTGQTAVVEFDLDPAAAGPGCYTV